MNRQQKIHTIVQRAKLHETKKMHFEDAIEESHHEDRTIDDLNYVSNQCKIQCDFGNANSRRVQIERR